MLVSINLAKIIGIYCLLVGIAMLINPNRFKNMINDFIQYPAALHMAAFITLILGIILTVMHNIWVGDWRVLITIIAWIILLNGLIRLFAPTVIVKLGQSMQSSSTFYFIATIITLIIGLILTYYGFAY